MLPVARVNDVHIEAVGDDLVLIDQRTQAAHSLNAAAAFVWERCDGAHSVEQIAVEGCALGMQLPASAVRETVDLLRAKQLLAAAGERRPRDVAQLTRRMLTKTAVAALVPAIVSIASPARAIALSGPGGDGPIL